MNLHAFICCNVFCFFNVFYKHIKDHFLTVIVLTLVPDVGKYSVSFLAFKEMTLKYCSLDTGFGFFTAFLSPNVSLNEVSKMLIKRKSCQHSDMTKAFHITIQYWASIVRIEYYISPV